MKTTDRAQELGKKFETINSSLGDSSLVAVSKYSPLEDIHHAYEWGQRDFGENRVPDLVLKASGLKQLHCDKIRWHFIGKLQSNKINQLFKIPDLYSIHSVDSLKLLKKLYQKQSQILGDTLFYFLQVKTSDEEEKSGLSSKEELYEAISFIEENKKGSKLKFFGLMTMGKMRTKEFEKEARQCFKSLIRLRKDIHRDFSFTDLKLSMGMSQDYKIAVELESDFVRIGSALFS
jgi:pyridoxal phosphate enzyme (YggS family)